MRWVVPQVLESLTFRATHDQVPHAEQLGDAAAASGGRPADDLLLQRCSGTERRPLPRHAAGKRCITGCSNGAGPLHVNNNHITVDTNTTTVQAAAMAAGRQISVVRDAGAAADHPVDPAYPEGLYLSNVLVSVI